MRKVQKVDRKKKNKVNNRVLEYSSFHNEEQTTKETETRDRQGKCEISDVKGANV